MKFIRKNGRIIPIREKAKDMISGASIGGAVGYSLSMADDLKSGTFKKVSSTNSLSKTFKMLSKGATYWAGVGAIAGSVTALALVSRKKGNSK